MDTVLDATIESHRGVLEAGTMLFDPTDPGTEPRLIVALTAEIVDGAGTVVSKHFEFVTLTSTGEALPTGPAPTSTCTHCPNRLALQPNQRLPAPG